MPFTTIADMTPLHLMKGVELRTFSGDRVMMSFVTFEPDGVVPEHEHPHEQMGTVMEGAFELVIDGEARVVRSGDAYQIPGGVPHSARGIGEHAVALDIFSPVREDYRDAAIAAAGATDE
jgi:quercetin dioxygenase-like cupin family protein